jgi:predicted dehydrogenase
MSDRIPLRVGVVGVGRMGIHHARVYSQMKHVDLVGVVDPDSEKGTQVAALYDCPYFPAAESLYGKVDAVSIAVPTTLHLQAAVPFLETGVHCLIEKPIATNDDEALRIGDAARAGGSMVQVGHIERFNPAVQEVRRLLDNQRPYAIEVRRMSCDSFRIQDVDVILDLMIHDLDIVLDLIDGQLVNINASGLQAKNGNGIDYGIATLEFEGPTVANLTASRITEDKVRKLSVTAEGMYIDLDYITKEVFIRRRSHLSNPNPTDYRLEASIEKVFVPQVEPLVSQLEHFTQSIREGRAPLVGLAQGRRALELAMTIRDRIRESWNTNA